MCDKIRSALISGMKWYGEQLFKTAQMQNSVCIGLDLPECG